MRRALITGATGNAGREVVREAIEAGLQVRAGVRRPEGVTEPVDFHEVGAVLGDEPTATSRAVACCAP